MNDFPELPARAFAKADPSPDPLFYAAPRFVTHIDDRAIRAVTDLYRRALPKGGRVLDVMSSWVSHLPEETAYAEVVGLGLNDAELTANPRLTRHIVQDLNSDPVLPLGDASFDGACCCVSIQYLQRPVAVMREVVRVLKPGAPFVVTFSDRCFPTKAVQIWQALDIDRVNLVALYLSRAGFTSVETDQPHRRDGGRDPLWAVTAHAPAGPAGQASSNPS
jgi:SAM-dependent methyltransferase